MREQFKGVFLVILLGLFALAGALIPGTKIAYAHEISVILTLIAVALGYRIYRHGIQSLIHKNITAQLFATIAIFISVIAGLLIPSASATGTAEAVGYLTAAAIVAFIILAGMTLEDYIIHRTRGALEALIKMTPKTARVRRDGEEVQVPIEEVKKGEIVLVKPGDNIPVDGTVISGHSTINQAPKKDGLMFLKELRDHKNEIPFILFTGKGREEVAVKALNLGADGYINKQGNPETVYGELKHTIQSFIEKAESKKVNLDFL